MVAELRCSAVSHIIDALVPPVMEKIVKGVRSISQERTRQRIVDVPEADQEQTTFESQPSVFRANTSCTGAVTSPIPSWRGTLPAKLMSRGRQRRKPLQGNSQRRRECC